MLTNYFYRLLFYHIDFYLTAKVDPQSTTEWMHRAFSGLIKRTGDNNAAIRSNAVDLVLVLAHTHHETSAQRDGYSLLDQFICKPERIIHNHKEALGRINLVQRALDELKLDDQDGIISLDQLMAFVMAYVYHNHGEVQQESMRLLLHIGTLVEWKQLSPLLDEDTRRSLRPVRNKKEKKWMGVTL